MSIKLSFSLLLLFSLAFSVQSSADPIHKCVTVNGKVKFQGRPCPRTDSSSLIGTTKKTINTHEAKNTPIFITSINEGIRVGAIKSAGKYDVEAWKRSSQYDKEFPSTIKSRQKFTLLKLVNLTNLPLSGAHSVIFIVGDRSLMPKGELGHSMVLLSDAGSCVGVLCRNL